MTPVVLFLSDAGRWLLDCALRAIAYTAFAGIMCFLVGIVCGIVIAAKDPPSWLSALAERAAPQAKPKDFGAGTPAKLHGIETVVTEKRH